jgi:hypothetical protein
MKKTEKTIQESLEQIKLNMNYELGKSLNEQVFSENPSWTGGGPLSPTAQNMTAAPAAGSQEMGDALLNQFVRRLNRNYSRIEGIMNSLNSYTYQGKPALAGIQAAYKTKYGKNLPNQTTAGGPTAPTPAAPVAGATHGAVGTKDAEGYKIVAGTPQDPYLYGTSGSGIKTVQQNLGFTGAALDGKWGPNTQKALVAKVPDVKQFTNEDLTTVLQKIRNNPAPSNLSLSNLASPNVAPSQPTAQLAGAANKGATNMAYGFKGA